MSDIIKDMVGFKVSYEVVKWPDRFQIDIRQVFRSPDGVTIFRSRSEAIENAHTCYLEWISQIQVKADKLVNILALDNITIDFQKK